MVKALMRLDKYLKVSRLIKRRTVAKNVAQNEKILVNNLPAKPSKEIKIGDLITIEYYNKNVTVKVTSLDIQIQKEKASEMYEFISEEIKH